MCGVVVAGGRGVENVSVWAPHISGVAAANVDTKVAPRPVNEARAERRRLLIILILVLVLRVPGLNLFTFTRGIY